MIKIYFLRKSKYKNVVRGRFVLDEGRLYFKSEKNIVLINEHFANNAATPERLIENTIRYDSENLKTGQ